MYPWEGKEYHRGAYSMEATGAEEGMFLSLIHISCREYGNLYRLNTGRNPRFICCNAGRGVAVIFDYSLNCIRTKESDEIRCV